MTAECYPMSTLPHTSKLFREYLAMGDDGADPAVRAWFGAEPFGTAWMQGATLPRTVNARSLADALERQGVAFGAGAETLANIAKLRSGARAVVTGQQVGLLGGPLLTLLKAATAVARAKQVTAATGIDHVPVFWLATEDHDLPEIDQVSLPAKTELATRSTGMAAPRHAAPVGDLALDRNMQSVLDWAAELLGQTPITELLQECYAAPDHGVATFGSSFARLMTKLFAGHGLIVMDASGRDFHTLGAPALRYAIEHAQELEVALLERTAQLERHGYHAQVMVKPGASLLFLVTEVDGVPDRQALRRLPDGSWKAGTGVAAASYSIAELLDILATAPERLSPNAILRPVFQDAILPTTAYIGGPAEIAYFAQSAVLYEQIVGRGHITPVLPRLSATVIEPSIGRLIDQHEVTLPDAMTTPQALAQRFGARAMPIEAKRRLAAAGNALDDALQAAQAYLGEMDESLGRSAKVSASKMRYQMNRLRRLAATFELQREASLRKHADAIALHLYPHGHMQERVLAGVWFVAAYEALHGEGLGTGLISRFVDEAATQCPGISSSGSEASA